MAALVGEENVRYMKWNNLIKVEKELFGYTMNDSAFRYLCTGDAFFEVGAEIALKQINLNITHRDQLYDTTKQQIVEAIPEGETSSFRMNVNSTFYEKLQKNHLRALCRQ